MLEPAQPDQPSQTAKPPGGDETARVRVRVEAPPGVRVRIIVEKDGLDGGHSLQPGAVVEGNGMIEVLPGPGVIEAAPQIALPRPSVPLGDRLRAAAAFAAAYARENVRWETALFAGAMLVYLLVRLIHLPDFPIYFFTDEAIQTVAAADFVRDGLRGSDKQLFPTYFLNSYQYNLSVSVYLQVLPYLLFGKSVWVTRGVSVLLSLLAGAGVGLMFKDVFRRPYAWAAVLLLSITPAWFLHSRTAFETVLGASFYAAFLYFYMRYRTDHPRSLYAAVVMGALCFYSYSPIRMVVGVTALLLFLVDLQYHWQQRKVALRGFGLALLFALPLLRFQLTHPQESVHHLVVLNSYWVQDLTLAEKLQRYATIYLSGIYPLYWYIPNSTDLSRHLMSGYGHLLWWTMPLMALGILVSLRNVRNPIYRVPVIALVAAPTGAALVGLGITRALVMVIPAAILSGIGLSAALEWLERRMKLSRSVVALPLFLLLAGYNITMMRDALTNGPLWFSDYGLGGMQYGANQIFREIDDYLAENPDTRLALSPAWANGTDTIARFYYKDPLPFAMGSIEGHFDHKLELDDSMAFVMIPQEYERVMESGKFTDVRVERTVPYPDGKPGFYFVRLRYVDDIDAILDEERDRRRVLQKEHIDVGGGTAEVSYSFLDMGSVSNLFDGDKNSFIRTMEANPFVLQVAFDQPRPISTVDVRVGGTATRILVTLKDQDGNVLWGDEQSVGERPDPRTVTFEVQQAHDAAVALIEVESPGAGEPAHVHVWEVTFQ